MSWLDELERLEAASTVNPASFRDALEHQAPRLLAIARAAERLTAALDIGRGYKGERDALRAALAGDGK